MSFLSLTQYLRVTFHKGYNSQICLCSEPSVGEHLIIGNYTTLRDARAEFELGPPGEHRRGPQAQTGYGRGLDGLDGENVA